MSEKVLVVDDERDIANLLEVYLQNENYVVYKYYCAKDAIPCIENEDIDLAILDVMLPDMNGFSLCQLIREKYTYPIIMLTAKIEETDKITGLTLGADDYVTKPFRPLEVVARVKAQLRRYKKYSPATSVAKIQLELSYNKLRLNTQTHECLLDGENVSLTGIGKVNAGMCTQILADVFGVEAVINTGIAGSLNNDVNIGDIVLSTDVLHHDMDAIGFGYKKGQIPQMDEFSFPADEKLRKLAAKVCKEVNPEISVFEGRICSGDQFISDKSVKDAIISEFGGFAVEMEGAAIGQAAYLNHIPFLVVRAISDKADGSAHMDYAEFEMAAIEHSVKLTVRMIQEL